MSNGECKGKEPPGVQQSISYVCAMLTLEEAAETFRRLLPLRMSARQALNLMKPVGKALAEREDEVVKALFEEALQSQTQEEEQASQKSSKASARLSSELDGILARMRHGSVPMEEEERKRKGDVYREMKVGAVFEAERGQNVLSWPQRCGSIRAIRSEPALRRSTLGQGGFGPLLYALAVQSGLSRAKQIVVLGDGAPWIWKLVTEHFPGAVQIVDLYHAKPHVWEVAHAVFGPSSQEACIWAKTACTLLVHGQIEELLAALGQLPKSPQPQMKAVVRQKKRWTTSPPLPSACAIPLFVRKRMYVGSGEASAACKTVVDTRAKRTGMRWTPDGLDAVLPLRTAKLNHTYDEFWQHQSRLLA